MRKSMNCCFVVVFLLLPQFLSFGSSRPQTEKDYHEAINQLSSIKRDITTPITTVPYTVPSSSSSPVLNPNSNPDTVSPASTAATDSPSSSSSSSSSLGSSWCVAASTASQVALQVALDYACGIGGADCSEIQPGGRCYNPNSVRDHASYAFNGYYQKNPVPNSCNFGGTAVITSSNPSSGTCQFPSTSTTSSILNTTNSIGANVFGSVPVPSSSAASPLSSNNAFSLIFHGILYLIIPFLANTCI